MAVLPTKTPTTRIGVQAYRIGDQLLGVSNCPHCGTASPTLKRAWLSDGPTYRADGKASSYWAAFTCTTCGGVVTAKGVAGERNQMPFVEAIFPAAWEAHGAIPDGVVRFLKQAKQTLGNTDASVLMSASAIDAMLKDKGLHDGSLYARIDEAVTKGFITKGMADWAHRVRFDANVSRHADESSPAPVDDDAQRAFDFAEALTEIMYVLPSRIPPKPA